MIRVITSQYAIEQLPNWQAFVEKMSEWVSQAKAKGADLFVLPEYAGVEIYPQAEEKDEVFF